MSCAWLTDVRHSSYKHGVCQTSEIPEITELRCEDPEIHGRRLWEHAHHHHKHHKHDRFLIRFGSPAERAIFNTLYLLTLWEVVAVPFFLCFGVYNISVLYRGVAAIDMTTTLIYGIGVALGLHTSVVDAVNAHECTDAPRIRAHMLTRWQTWADLLSILALPMTYVPSFSTFGHLLRLSKCWRLPQNPKRHMLLYFAQHAEHARLVRIMVSILVLAHLYACFWFSVRMKSASQNGVPEWLCNGQVADKPLHALTFGDLEICYVYSLHDSVSMLSGWGSPEAFHDLEISSQIVIGLLNDCIMSYIYGMFVAAISFASISEDRFAERTAILHAACNNMHLPDGLRFRVCRYHSYLSMNHMGMESQELFDNLSVNLRSELRIFRMREALISAHFFRGLKPRLSVLLVSACTEQVFSPGDMVIRKGDVGDCMYIILRGVVSVLIDDAANVQVASLHKNQCFGEVSLLLGRSVRTAWVRAETFTVLSRLEKDRFEACLDDGLKKLILARIAAHVQRQFEQNVNKTVALNPSNIENGDTSSCSSMSFSSEDSWSPMSSRPLLSGFCRTPQGEAFQAAMKRQVSNSSDRFKKQVSREDDIPAPSRRRSRSASLVFDSMPSRSSVSKYVRKVTVLADEAAATTAATAAPSSVEAEPSCQKNKQDSFERQLSFEDDIQKRRRVSLLDAIAFEHSVSTYVSPVLPGASDTDSSEAELSGQPLGRSTFKKKVSPRTQLQQRKRSVSVVEAKAAQISESSSLSPAPPPDADNGIAEDQLSVQEGQTSRERGQDSRQPCHEDQMSVSFGEELHEFCKRSSRCIEPCVAPATLCTAKKERRWSLPLLREVNQSSCAEQGSDISEKAWRDLAAKLQVQQTSIDALQNDVFEMRQLEESRAAQLNRIEAMLEKMSGREHDDKVLGC